MADFAELEIRVQRQYAENYPVEVRFSQPDSDDEKELTPADATPLQLDLARLRELGVDGDEYGRTLSDMLFKGWVGEALTTARRSAQQQGAALRVRLFIAPSAWDLHGLRWEALPV